MSRSALFSRRAFLSRSLAAGCALGEGHLLPAAVPEKRTAQIAITLDLEMSRNFPTWSDTHWDYEKGNLNEETKRYAREACRRVKRHGGVLHCFAVGRVLEQEDVSWLREIAAEGHPIGNHTYDHVNVKARHPEDIQFRFRRAPWLIAGKGPEQVIRENIAMTSAALRRRLGVASAGFRTPGGFNNGLADRLDVQRMLLDLGFRWVSSKYAAHPLGSPRALPAPAVFAAIVKAQEQSQPFAYPSGLVEVPMSPVSDISAFRAGRWPLTSFLKAVRLGVEWAIAHGKAFDFLGHPSCLYVVDPKFETIELICELVRKAKDRAALADLGTISRRARK